SSHQRASETRKTAAAAGSPSLLATRRKASGGSYWSPVLRAEAAWLARRLERVNAEQLSPLVSVGSGHAELRAAQPWLERLIYAPLTRRGVRVLHHELEPTTGVDFAGDLTDPVFLER